MHLVHKHHPSICTGQACAAEGRLAQERHFCPPGFAFSRSWCWGRERGPCLPGPLAGVSLHRGYPLANSAFLPAGMCAMLPSDLACVGPVLYHVLGSWKISAGIQCIQVQGCICLQVYFCRPKRNPKRAGLAEGLGSWLPWSPWGIGTETVTMKPALLTRVQLSVCIPHPTKTSSPTEGHRPGAASRTPGGRTCHPLWNSAMHTVRPGPSLGRGPCWAEMRGLGLTVLEAEAKWSWLPWNLISQSLASFNKHSWVPSGPQLGEADSQQPVGRVIRPETQMRSEDSPWALGLHFRGKRTPRSKYL